MAVTDETTTTGSVERREVRGTDTAQVGTHGSSGDTIHTSGEVSVNETYVKFDQAVTDPEAANAVLVEGQGGEGTHPEVPGGDVPHGGVSGDLND